MSNSANNVVVFPKSYVHPTDQQKLEDIQHNLEMMKQYHIQETITNLAPMIFNQLDIAGFGLAEEDIDEDIKDGAFIIEALRSLMCKHYGIYHPFQVLAENVFSVNEDEEGVFKIVDSINIDLKEPEEEI
jgi:hypothetical protein